MKNTLRYWINTLPEDVRELAMKNCMDNYECYDDISDILDNTFRDNLYNAISCAFVYSETPEGLLFWQKVIHDNTIIK